MNWFRVENEKRNQPQIGDYPDWKDQIAEDCSNQCVYCCIHESAFGGIDNFHVEHFRPKSKFPELRKRIANLYYSCPICNRFKSDDWPGEPCDKFLVAAYVDPGEHDFSDLIQNSEAFRLRSIHRSATYFIERLYLNRPQLIRRRREHSLATRFRRLNEYFQTIVDQLMDDETVEGRALAKEVFQVVLNANLAKSEVDDGVPYQRDEVRRREPLRNQKKKKK